MPLRKVTTSVRGLRVGPEAPPGNSMKSYRQRLEVRRCHSSALRQSLWRVFCSLTEVADWRTPSPETEAVLSKGTGNCEADVAPSENELDTPVLYLCKIEVRSSCLATFLVSPWWRKELSQQVVSRNPGCTAQASSVAQGCRPWDWPTYNRGLKVRVCTQGQKCTCQSKGQDGKTLSIIFFWFIHSRKINWSSHRYQTLFKKLGIWLWTTTTKLLILGESNVW